MVGANLVHLTLLRCGVWWIPNLWVPNRFGASLVCPFSPGFFFGNGMHCCRAKRAQGVHLVHAILVPSSKGGCRRGKENAATFSQHSRGIRIEEEGISVDFGALAACCTALLASYGRSTPGHHPIQSHPKSQRVRSGCAQPLGCALW